MGYVMVCTYYVPYVPFQRSPSMWQPHNLLNNPHDFGCFLLLHSIHTNGDYLGIVFILGWIPHSLILFGGFLSHGGTPVHHPFCLGFSMKSTSPKWPNFPTSLRWCLRLCRRLSASLRTATSEESKRFNDLLGLIQTHSCNRDIFMGYNNNGI